VVSERHQPGLDDERMSRELLILVVEESLGSQSFEVVDVVRERSGGVTRLGGLETKVKERREEEERSQREERGEEETRLERRRRTRPRERREEKRRERGV